MGFTFELQSQGNSQTSIRGWKGVFKVVGVASNSWVLVWNMAPLKNSQGNVSLMDKEKTRLELFIVIKLSQGDNCFYKNSSCILKLCFPMGGAAVGDACFTKVIGKYSWLGHFSAVKCSTVHCSSVKFSEVQWNAVQFNTIHYRIL